MAPQLIHNNCMVALMAHTAFHSQIRSQRFSHKLLDFTRVATNITPPSRRSVTACQCSQTIQIAAASATNSTTTTRTLSAIRCSHLPLLMKNACSSPSPALGWAAKPLLTGEDLPRTPGESRSTKTLSIRKLRCLSRSTTKTTRICKGTIPSMLRSSKSNSSKWKQMSTCHWRWGLPGTRRRARERLTRSPLEATYTTSRVA